MDVLEAVAQDPTFAADPMQDSPAVVAEQTEAVDQVRHALQALPDEQRNVVVMSYYQGYSHSQIAERLQVPVGTVKSHMRLALTKLRAELGSGGANQ